MAEGNLRKLLFTSRKPIRELEKLGVSRRELIIAVRAINTDGEWPRGESDQFKAEMIAAELVSNPEIQLPPTADGEIIDQIIRLITELMPLIEAWMEMCM